MVPDITQQAGIAEFLQINKIFPTAYITVEVSGLLNRFPLTLYIKYMEYAVK